MTQLDGPPLTRREAREREAAAARGPIEAPEYPAVRESVAPPILTQLRPSNDPPQRSATARSRTPARGSSGPRGRKVKVAFAKAPRRRHSIGSRLFSLGALLGAAALLVGMSVPANAFMDRASHVATGAVEREPGQSLAVSENAIAGSTARDGFEVISYAEVLRQKYAGISYAYTATTGAVRWPFPYPVPITDGFGLREYNEFHNGVDFVPGHGTPIYAIADGVVVAAQELQWSFGNHVIVQHNLGGVNVQSLYAHMVTGSSPLQVGDQVKVGDFVGLVGDTGRAYGSHLHFEVHIDGVPVDPFAWLQANAVN